MNFFKKIVTIALFFGLAAVAVYPIKNALATKSINIQSLKASLKNGSLFAVLGGYRSLVADFVWIKGYVNWEAKDVSKCVSAIELASSIAPDMTMFWTQGASIIAFDTPHWLWQRLPEKIRTDEKLNFFKKRQGLEAIAFIDKALKTTPNNYEFLIQKGQIAIAIKDFHLAQECFGVASKINNGFYARRIYASLLAKNGDFKKSAEVLKSMLSETEDDNPVRPLIKAQLEAIEKIKTRL